MDVGGFIPLALAGMAGAGLFELFRVLAARNQSGRWPSPPQWALSVLSILTALLVPLLYGTGDRPFLEVAQLGVGIPALISGGFSVSAASSRRRNAQQQRPASVSDYAGFRFAA